MKVSQELSQRGKVIFIIEEEKRILSLQRNNVATSTVKL